MSATQASATGRPSDSWSKHPNLDKNPDVKNVIETADWTYLTAEATKHHPLHATCEVNTDRWTCGNFNGVFELSFSDGSFWIARVRLFHDDEQVTKTEMLSELATLNIVRERTSIPVPTVFAYNCETPKEDNPFGFPYMLTNVLPGTPLPSGRRIAAAVPKESLPKVAGQLADIFWQLSRLTFDNYGRIWCGVSLDEPPVIIEDFLPMPWSGEPSEAPKYEIPSPAARRAGSGPFMLCHQDLGGHNILFDDQHNITGILDWTQSGTVQPYMFARHLDLKPSPYWPDELKNLIAEFRDLFISALRRLEERHSQVSSTGGGLASPDNSAAMSASEMSLADVFAKMNACDSI